MNRKIEQMLGYVGSTSRTFAIACASTVFVACGAGVHDLYDLHDLLTIPENLDAGYDGAKHRDESLSSSSGTETTMRTPQKTYVFTDDPLEGIVKELTNTF